MVYYIILDNTFYLKVTLSMEQYIASSNSALELKLSKFTNSIILLL